MEPAPATPSGPNPSHRAPSGPVADDLRPRRRRRRRGSSERIPRSHALCDAVSGGLILFLVVFTPWAFGTTQEWSIWTANIACYLLGILLAAKWVIRRLEGYQPPRWGEPIVLAEDSGELAAPRSPTDGATRLLAVLTIVLLGYILISALNARAIYNPVRRDFQYLGDPIAWLPHSYDRASTWFAFWQYLGIACAFWGIRDWLIQRFGSDTQQDDAPSWANAQAHIVIPARLQTLLWVLCLNGALLALVGILQRANGTSKLLWILESASQKSAENMFGPWSYRGNASQYFNLLWPVCLAFWIWAQERAGRALTARHGRLDGPQILLLPCAIFMAACPMISSSRGGAVVSILIGIAAVLLLLFACRREIAPALRWITVGAMFVAAAAALVGGWSSVRDRLLRTDRAFPTGIETGADDFTFLVRLNVPDQPPKKWLTLGGLSRDARSLWQPHAAVISLAPNGSLYAQLFGSSLTNVVHGVATNFTQKFAGQEVSVAVVRHDGVRIFANGQELGLAVRPKTERAGWSSLALTRFAYSIDPSVAAFALVNYALSNDEIEATSKVPAAQLSEALLAQNTLANDAVLSTNELVFPEGVGSQLITRPSDPSVLWMRVRRDAGPGVLAVRRTLPTLDNRIRGPMRAAFTAWNPSNDPILLAVTLDGSSPHIVEVPGRSESAIRAAVRAPHSHTPQVLDVYLADDDGNAITDAPEGTHFALRELRLQTDGAAFIRTLDQRPNLADLSDRMSGRNEVYANARRMANDYVWWGSGAGTFTSLHQFYLQPGQIWAAYAHHDWLETRITFGRIGLVLICLALGLIFLRSWIGRGLQILPLLIAYWWLALGGCLVHAIFDFPFQVYSVFFLFSVLAAILLVLTGARRR
jgi:hypothetical protein